MKEAELIELANVTLNETLANLSQLNESEIADLRNEVNDLNLSIFSIEASLMITALITITFILFCMMFSCWYFLILKNKSKK